MKNLVPPSAVRNRALANIDCALAKAAAQGIEEREILDGAVDQIEALVAV